MKHFLSPFRKGLFFAALFTSSAAFAVSDIFPEPISDLSNFVFGDGGFDAHSTSIELRITLSCYRVNVRRQRNGLNTNATLMVTIPIQGRPDRLNIVFPAQMFLGTTVDPNVLKVVEPIPAGTQVEFNPDTRVLHVRTSLNSREQLGKVAFFQVLPFPAPDPVRNSDGSRVMFRDTGGERDFYDKHSTYVTHSVSQRTSAEGRVAEIHAAFPGARHHCGSYRSPLVLFFDDKRPMYSGKSRMLVEDAQADYHFWPEPGAPGYFLAVDRDGDGVISKKGELFAGFERLREFDSNKDGVIDSRDKDFGRLQLWADADSNSRSSAGELSSLRDKGVSSIPLRYDADRLEPLGHYAEVREFGTFKYLDRGVRKQGKALDVWFKEIRKPWSSLAKSQ